MNINLIKTENDYNQALERLEIIFDAKKGTNEGDELELLGILIDQYEKDSLGDFSSVHKIVSKNYIS